MPPLLYLDDIHLTFGGAPLFDGAALSLGPHDRIALVGRNGSGKSTLLKIAAGLVEPASGEVFRQPGATIRYLSQTPDMDGHATVSAYAEAGLAPGDDPHRVTFLLDQLGLDGESDARTLSGGEARRAALARVLAPRPDILLLDEPTNHLDLAAIEWLESELAAMECALIVISHDRRFLERVTRSVLWLDRARTRRLDRGFAHFEDWRDTVLEEEDRAHHKLGRKIAREQHWVVHGVSGRRKRNMRRLAELQALRAAWRERRPADGTARMEAARSDASGKLVAEAEGVSKHYGGHAIVSDFSLRLQRGDRLGIVGPNGAGKTTLLNLLTGRLAPDSGALRLGANVQLATLDQSRAALEPTDTPTGFLTGGRGDQLVVDGKPRHVTGWLKDFGFAPEQARTPIRDLSGGEKARLLLAGALARPANLLVLDEPTNDLDMETLDLLQELIAGFQGTVLLVSHDRDFLDLTVTATLAPAGDGRWLAYAGGYSDMLAQRGARSFAEMFALPGRKGGAPRTRSGSDRPAAPARPRSKKKLSYKQKHALETLPDEIEALAAAIAKLETRLADPTLFATDPAGFEAAAAALEAKRGALEASEAQWLELELLREEIEG